DGIRDLIVTGVQTCALPIYDLGREEFIKRVWQWKEKHGGIIISQLKKLGCSCDWTRERFTMDPEYVRNVQRVFVDLYKKGLIYRSEERRVGKGGKLRMRAER